MGISYDYYRIFYYVAKYKSFSRAAQVLSSNQPNITRSMNNLESQLGCVLFIRSNRGIILTNEGKQLYDHVAIAYQQLQAAERELANTKSLEKGIINLCVSETALRVYFLPIMNEFRKRYPHIHLQLSSHTTPQALQSLKNGESQLSIITTPATVEYPLRQTQLCDYEEILVAGKKYMSLADKPRHLYDLEDHPLICLSKDTMTYAFYHDLFVSNHAQFHVDIEAASTDQIVPMIENELGIGFVAKSIAKSAIKHGKVVEIPLIEKIPKRYVCLVEDRSHPLGVAGRALKRLLIEKSE
ncbi:MULTISPECIES: LysR family transcriptional regulator [Coprobacillaceae]|uniref:LysR family transcriptional regulator n=1 Tax=Coprobacillaceae TaxID=2810280 RepID=UPI000E506382|nr:MULTISPECIES: LysR family transcriptional regulator [Coprobacillaceae]RHM61690.1 LysR family transcriptional regulator [Coprobacillus sp. AF33-1AC]RHS92524.1 LysR family transcriptional regulator [Erysipelatoclostridium sp. AM42-17]